jgi:hypothetical protein
VTLVVAVLILLPSALADEGPRLSARHHTIEFAGENDEGDRDWRWGVTICSSRAARIKLRHDTADADGPPGTGGYATWYVRKKRAGCKRYTYYVGSYHARVRSRVRLKWGRLRATTPWVEATCLPSCP